MAGEGDELSRANFTAHVERLGELADGPMGSLWTEIWYSTPPLGEATSFAAAGAGHGVPDLGRSFMTVVEVINSRLLHGAEVIEASRVAIREIAGTYATADGQR